MLLVPSLTAATSHGPWGMSRCCPHLNQTGLREEAHGRQEEEDEEDELPTVDEGHINSHGQSTMWQQPDPAVTQSSRKERHILLFSAGYRSLDALVVLRFILLNSTYEERYWIFLLYLQITVLWSHISPMMHLWSILWLKPPTALSLSSNQPISGERQFDKVQSLVKIINSNWCNTDRGALTQGFQAFQSVYVSGRVSPVWLSGIRTDSGSL